MVWSVSNHQDQPTSQPIDRLSLVQIVRLQREDEDEPSPTMIIIYLSSTDWRPDRGLNPLWHTDDYVRSLIANKEYHFMVY